MLDLDAAREGWLRFRRMLLLKLGDAADARVTVRQAGFERPLGVYQEAGAAAGRIRWGPIDLKGWARGRQRGAPCRVGVGLRGLRLEGEAPAANLFSPRLCVDATRMRVLRMALRLPGPGKATGHVYWSRRDAPGFAQERSARLHVPAGEGLRVATTDLSAIPAWRGTVTSLRVVVPLRRGEAEVRELAIEASQGSR